MDKNVFNHTTRVEAVIEKLETVLEKSRDSLLDEEVCLLNKCIAELKEIKLPPEEKQYKLRAEDVLLISKVLVKLLRFFNIDIDLF